MSSENYISSDDSVLLRGVLAKYSGDSCLEIGAGSGGGVEILARSFGLVVGTDLRRPPEIHHVECAQLVLADSASCFRERSFDLVAFNPPYLPSDSIDDITIDGGKDGIIVAMRFLRDAIRVVKRGGRILLLLSSDNPLSPIRDLCETNGLSIRLLKTRRLFYESICAYEISDASGRGGV